MVPLDKTRWRTISPLLDELLELDAAARAALLARIGKEDAPLAEALASLLEADASARRERFLEGTADVVEAQPAATLAGRTIGAYTLDEPLGVGGMGSVWLAHRSDGRFEGRAAVKFLNLALVGRGGA